MVNASLQRRSENDSNRDVSDGRKDAASALVGEKVRRVSLTPSDQIPKVTDIQEDIPKKLQSMSQRTRYARLATFVAIKVAWFGFVLSCHFHVIETVSEMKPSHYPETLHLPHDALLRSGLFTIGIIVQLVALLPVAEIIVEVYSGEWSDILSVERGFLTRMTDRVSTLTSTCEDRALHVLAAGLLSVLLQVIAPGALTVTSYIASKEMELTIGALQAGRTNDTLPMASDNIEVSVNTVLAHNLLQEAARCEYVAWIQNSIIDFVGLVSITQIDQIESLGAGYKYATLWNAATRIAYAYVRYTSDAVSFQFTCQWLAPTYLGGSLLLSCWSFGGR